MSGLSVCGRLGPAALRAVLLLLLAWVHSLARAGDASAPAWQPTAYQLELRPDFVQRRIEGVLDLAFSVPAGQPLHALRLDAGSLTIDAVEQGAQAVPFTQSQGHLLLRWPQPLSAGVQVVRIRYHGTPTSGLRFDADTRQVATAFSTSQWMPCVDDPAVRAPFALALVLPQGMVTVGNGVALPTEALAHGLERHRWQLDWPQPSYLYGFAAGDFAQAQVKTPSGITLHHAGPQAVFDADALQRIFTDTADMLAFYADKAGVDYPLPAYRQVLLMGPAAQEMAGLSVMGARYGTRVLADPAAIWLGAHEAAHQWWGNGITNRSWRHFWLNEGIASFMTAAYLEHRFGREAYDRQIEAARVKLDALRAQGLDKPLVFPDWDHPSAADRSLVYDKGTLALHALREHLGEARFWAGLRHYTRTRWGQSVETADFQRAMEAGSGVDLQGIFDSWVYRVASAASAGLP